MCFNKKETRLQKLGNNIRKIRSLFMKEHRDIPTERLSTNLSREINEYIRISSPLNVHSGELGVVENTSSAFDNSP